MANESACLRAVNAAAASKTRFSFSPARALAAAGLAVLLGVPVPAQAAKNREGYFAVSYAVAINGLPIGKGSFSGRVGGGAYRLKGDARLTGIAGVFFDYKAYGEVDGHLGRENHSPRKFGSTASDNAAAQTVSMAFSRGRVQDLDIDPKPRPRPDRIEVRASHMRNVVDPMTALIVTASGKDGAARPDDCNRKIPVFNGRERFDLVLRYKSTQALTGNRRNTYTGPVVVCQALYRPIAGHIKNRDDVDYYANQKGLEVWLAPAGNTGLLVPVRMVVPTPIGSGIITATGFTASFDTIKHTSATR